MHVSRLMDIIEDKYTYLQDTDKMDCKMVWIAIYCYIVDIFCTGMYDKLDKKTVTDIYSTNEEYVQRIKWNKIEKKSYQYAYDIKSWMKNVNPDLYEPDVGTGITNILNGIPTEYKYTGICALVGIRAILASISQEEEISWKKLID